MTDDLTALRALAEAGKALDPGPIGFGTIEAYRAMHNVLSFDAVLALLDRLERAEGRVTTWRRNASTWRARAERAEAAIERAKALVAEDTWQAEGEWGEHDVVNTDQLLAALDTGKETGE